MRGANAIRSVMVAEAPLPCSRTSWMQGTQLQPLYAASVSGQPYTSCCRMYSVCLAWTDRAHKIATSALRPVAVQFRFAHRQFVASSRLAHMRGGA